MTPARCSSPPARRVGLISQIPVYPAGYTVEDVLRSAFQRTTALKEEMDRLTRQMEQGDSDPQTLRRGTASLPPRFEGLGGYDTDTAVNKVSNGLSIDGDMRQRLFDQLSGGEKTRVNLGRLILEDTDILLLDEPTNHLDLQATEWLEDYIRSFRGTVVTISHDRYFLDRTVTRVIEILDGKAEFYSGNYSFYAVEKERRYQERMKQYLKEQAKIQQLEKAAEQMHLWAFMGNDALHKRAFSMEKRIERMRTVSKPTRAKKMDARFAEPGVPGRRGTAAEGRVQVLRRPHPVFRRVPAGGGRRAHRLSGRKRRRENHPAEHDHRGRARGQRHHPHGARHPGGLSASDHPL